MRPQGRLSSPVMQEMMGVNEPDFGDLLDTMFVFKDSELEVTTLCQPKVEVEVAFVLEDSLPPIGCNVADVLRAAAYVVPAIEIIDSRFANWKMALCDTVADNARSTLLMLGGRTTLVDRVGLWSLGATLRHNGKTAATGSNGAVLGNRGDLGGVVGEQTGRLRCQPRGGFGGAPRLLYTSIRRLGDCVQAELGAVGGMSIAFT